MRWNLSTEIGNARFGRFQASILILCFLILLFDGYDLVVMGVALPSIISTLKMDIGIAGVIASCALFGMMFGAVLTSLVADRVGRVATTAMCVLVFSAFTAVSGLAEGPRTFAVLRFVAGLGLGGVVPCITATLADYAPTHLRSRLTTAMLAGVPLGGILAALVGKHYMEALGWQFVFFVAGAPILLVPVILRVMPDSMVKLQRCGDKQRLFRMLRRVDPSRSLSDADEVYLSLPVSQARLPVTLLFREHRGFSTAMLWTIYFSGMFMLYALASWLPKLMALAGHGLNTALTLLLIMNFGWIAGLFLGGWLSDRFGVKRVMTLMLLAGVIGLVLTAQNLPIEPLSVVIFVVGMTVSGAQGLATAYAAQFYPNDVRLTGLGMMYGVGRVGGIAAPMVIGLLLSMHFPVHHILYVIAVFGILQAIATMLVDDSVAASSTSKEPNAHPKTNLTMAGTSASNED